MPLAAAPIVNISIGPNAIFYPPVVQHSLTHEIFFKYFFIVIKFKII